MDKYKKLVNVNNEMELGDFGSVESDNEQQTESVVTEQPTTQVPISQHPGTSTIQTAAHQATHLRSCSVALNAILEQNLISLPPGLEYLTMVDQFLINQKVEMLEVLTGFETNNKYKVLNSRGQKVYFACEENNWCNRNFCGPARSFNMKILDNYGREVIHLNRPFACGGCCFPCCLQSMEVTAPPGTLIGTIKEEWSFCKPLYTIRNVYDEPILRIKGPICKSIICGDVEFHIYRDRDILIGKISRQWSGLTREIFTDANYFGISFPVDLDERMKAVLLGALFLIDFMYFEKAG